MNTQIAQYLEAQLNLREQLKERILAIVSERCDTGVGRVQRGALHFYIYSKLGLKGKPGNHFHKYLSKVLEEAGYRDSYLEGVRCTCGLTWKGETKEDWRYPKAEDLPKFSPEFGCFVL